MSVQGNVEGLAGLTVVRAERFLGGHTRLLFSDGTVLETHHARVTLPPPSVRLAEAEQAAVLAELGRQVVAQVVADLHARYPVPPPAPRQGVPGARRKP